MKIFNNLIERLAPRRKEAGGILASLQARANGQSARMAQGNISDYLGKFADQAWIYSCIKIIQTKGAGVPLKVYKKVGDKKVEQPLHPLQQLLDSVNPMMNGYDLREATHGFVELAGNSYWLLDAFVAGKPTEIYPLNPKCIRIKADKTKYITGYDYELQPGKIEQSFKPEEILHFKTWNPLDPYYGLAPICAARDSADTMMFSDQYNKAFFQNGAEPGGYLSSDTALDESVVKRIRSMWNKTHQSARRAHTVAILDSGMKFTSSAQTHQDMQFQELKRMTREDVLTVFNMPPIMVGVFDEANYSNAREQRRIFWIDCMIPRLRKIESVINERLAKPYSSDLVVEHDLTQVEALADDERLRAQADSSDVQAGIVTINEVRKKRNLAEVDWGNTWHRPFGLQAVDDAESDDEPANPTPTSDKPEAPKKPGEEENPPKQPEPAKAKASDEPVIDQQKVRRDDVWARYKGHTEKQEKKWIGPMRKLFSDQEREVINNLRESDWQKSLNQNKLDKFKNLKASLDLIIFDRSKSLTVFRKESFGLIQATLKASALKEILDNDLGIDFDLADHNVQTWIGNKAFKFAEEVTRTTEEALRSQLSDAITLGETLTDVEDRIAQVFDIARSSRTAMIARTEVIAASNAGAQESYKQSGVVKGQEWITSRDNLVRESHEIDGEVVLLGATFSNGLKFPGDPDGEPGNVINCRCTIAPIVNKGDE